MVLRGRPAAGFMVGFRPAAGGDRPRGCRSRTAALRAGPGADASGEAAWPCWSAGCGPSLACLWAARAGRLCGARLREGRSPWGKAAVRRRGNSRLECGTADSPALKSESTGSHEPVGGGYSRW